MRVLEVAKARNPKLLTKTSIMLGLGETREEVSVVGTSECQIESRRACWTSTMRC